jgi:organic radical activating enzyme
MKIPIKVERATATKHKFIEWMIHDVCNYNCSFCCNENKAGINRWTTIEKYKEYADKIISQCDGNPLWIQFTGGEPTLFPDLLELMQYVKNKGAYVSLLTNGSRTLRWWEELKQGKCLDNLMLTYHPEQTNDYIHAANVLNLFHYEETSTSCLITHTYSVFDKSIIARDYMRQHTGAYIIYKAMKTEDMEVFSEYTVEQLKEVMIPSFAGDKIDSKVKPKIPSDCKLSDFMKISYNNGIKEVVSTQHLLKTKQNNFNGWMCNVGMNTIRIANNKFYRGICEEGGIQGSLDGEIKFSTQEIRCTKNRCYCDTDLFTTKTR